MGDPAAIDEQGFTLVSAAFSAEQCAALARSLPRPVRSGQWRQAGARLRFSAMPLLAAFAASPGMRALIEPLIGAAAFAVRAVLFDKDAEVNWQVPWHRDRAIAVRRRIDLLDFGPWSVKDGVAHVEPPRAILAAMLAVRCHLDDCDADSGPLRVIPSSHRDQDLTAGVGGRQDVVCLAPRGSALRMRPQLLHASSPVRAWRRRRVLHLEFAAADLPGGLQWNERMPP